MSRRIRSASASVKATLVWRCHGYLNRPPVEVGQQLAGAVHGVDAVLTGEVATGEEKLEVQPPAEPDDHGSETLPGGSGVPVGQQLAGAGSPRRCGSDRRGCDRRRET